ncbi:hypothetical protein [Kitasatospora phosalacinea]|uniref:Uncharacterized protein n=1 Tax=Kitasatospora phosalacinea TaxID=2065 RepID=A0A9W6PFJ8_9ACTN|nr:hypothetical protein [Kitasatospora phosalacinea]GLW53992.1 hypothetical protein Kpho01_20030 [Kitasatospora phosalacinea]
MYDTTAWASLAFIPLLLAGLAAWILSGATDLPTGRHRAGDRPLDPYVIELVGQRRARWDSDERAVPTSATPPPPRPATFITEPKSTRSAEDDHTRRAVAARVDRLEGRAVGVPDTPTMELRLLPCATTRVVPRWVARFEAQQQAQRRRALEAAATGRPDTGYTYPGAHTLMGVPA